MDWLIVALTAYILIVPIELPDKTFIATLVLSTRHAALPVWLGVVAAFAVQCAVAVGAGHLLARLPERPVALAAAALFAVGAVILLRSARRTDADGADQEQEYAAKVRDGRKGWRAAAASFLVLFAAEWGDLSQLLTAGLVASGKPPIPVFVGSLAALATVSGLAVLAGRWLVKHVRLAVIRYVGAAVCGVLAVITVVSTL